MFDCAKKVVAKEGPGGLYRGLTTLIAGSIPKASIRFGAYQQFSNLLKNKETGKLSKLGGLGAGLGAGVSEALLAVTPMETVKTKLIADQNSANPRYRVLSTPHNHMLHARFVVCFVVDEEMLQTISVG